MASIKIKDVQSQSISEETYSLCKVLAEAMPLLQKKKLKKKTKLVIFHVSLTNMNCAL